MHIDSLDLAGCLPPTAPGRQADVHGQLHGDGPCHRRAHVLPSLARPVHQGLLPNLAQVQAAEYGCAKPPKGQLPFHHDHIISLKKMLSLAQVFAAMSDAASVELTVSSRLSATQDGEPTPTLFQILNMCILWLL